MDGETGGDLGRRGKGRLHGGDEKVKRSRNVLGRCTPGKNPRLRGKAPRASGVEREKGANLKE